MSGRSMASEMFGKTYIVKVLDDGECITEGELIRCRDCKYWNGSGKYCDYEMSGLEDDFCSWAERKEE